MRLPLFLGLLTVAALGLTNCTAVTKVDWSRIPRPGVGGADDAAAGTSAESAGGTTTATSGGASPTGAPGGAASDDADATISGAGGR